MMSTISSYENDRAVLLGREIDDLLLRLRGLVLVRDVLAERQATPAEIDAHTRELERLREELANTISGHGPAPMARDGFDQHAAA
jgi:hypothetical protein